MVQVYYFQVSVLQLLVPRSVYFSCKRVMPQYVSGIISGIVVLCIVLQLGQVCSM